MSSDRKDLYANITNRIVEQLEAGVRPWHRPWDAQHAAGSVSRPLRHNGQPYQGVNILVLWLSAHERGYTSPLWLTFNQAKDLGGHVKKGEQGTSVVYANTFEKTTTDEATGEETKARIPFLKSYTVFNSNQIEGLPGHFNAVVSQPKTRAERLDAAEQFFAATGVETRFGGNRAYYSPSGDYIQLPLFETFESRESYYSTQAHELIHASGHEKRLNRSFEQKRFGDAGYAFEELIAELGAAFLSADLGIAPEVMPEHAEYLSCWLKVLKADSKAIFTAASHATKAADYWHHQHQPQPESEPVAV